MPPDRHLSRHLRFARSLALVSGATLGIAAGAALVVPAGCVRNCAGSPCGDYVPPPVTHPDGGADASAASDGARDADAAGPDAGAGGGPLAAPPLPASWLA